MQKAFFNRRRTEMDADLIFTAEMQRKEINFLFAIESMANKPSALRALGSKSSIIQPQTHADGRRLYFHRRAKNNSIRHVNRLR